MSVKVKTSIDTFGEVGGGRRDLVIQFNNLVTKFDALLAKLDADAGVTDTNYTSTLDSNSSGGGQTIGDITGTKITA